ncbi:hypothetical protein KA107_01610 [Candidatus Pacearchaeota archaeon]|nr:hypothetical protein [Candidatus Pacearchaeota archaeon]
MLRHYVHAERITSDQVVFKRKGLGMLLYSHSEQLALMEKAQERLNADPTIKQLKIHYVIQDGSRDVSIFDLIR